MQADTDLGLCCKHVHDVLTLKAHLKILSTYVVCCIFLHFSNLHFAYRQTVWTQIRLLLKEQSDLGPHCLQDWQKTKQMTIVVIGALRVKRPFA